MAHISEFASLECVPSKLGADGHRFQQALKGNYNTSTYGRSGKHCGMVRKQARIRWESQGQNANAISNMSCVKKGPARSARRLHHLRPPSCAVEAPLSKQYLIASQRTQSTRIRFLTRCVKRQPRRERELSTSTGFFGSCYHSLLMFPPGKMTIPVQTRPMTRTTTQTTAAAPATAAHAAIAPLLLRAPRRNRPQNTRARQQQQQQEQHSHHQEAAASSS